MTEWNLRSRSHTCHKCSRALIDGERCHSVVAEFIAPIVQELLAERIAAQANDPKPTKPPEFVRLDICPECWKDLKNIDWISLWHSRYTAPEPPAPEPLPRETAESLLRKLIEDDDSDENTAVIFILAVMLERKKIYIERSVRHSPDGTLVRVYEHKKSGEVMLITDPNLQLDEIPGVQQQIKLLLEPPTPPEVSPEPLPEGDTESPAADTTETPEPPSDTGAT